MTLVSSPTFTKLSQLFQMRAAKDRLRRIRRFSDLILGPMDPPLPRIDTVVDDVPLPGSRAPRRMCLKHRIGTVIMDTRMHLPSTQGHKYAVGNGLIVRDLLTLSYDPDNVFLVSHPHDEVGLRINLE